MTENPNKLYRVSGSQMRSLKNCLLHGLFFFLYGFVKYLPFPFCNQLRFAVIRLFAKNIHSTAIWDGVFFWFPWRVRIGKNCSLRQGVIIDGFAGVTIGNNVRIASYTSLNSSEHDYTDCETPIAQQGFLCGEIVIEDDVWIGNGVNINKGVTIGRGSVIGAGAVVTHDIPPYSIAAGVPCRVIKSRKNGNPVVQPN